MQPPRNFFGAPILALLSVLLVLVAVGCDGVGGVEDKGSDAARPQDASKTFVAGAPTSATFADKGGKTWTISFQGDTSSKSTWSYRVVTDANPSAGSFIALETPTCAGNWLAANPTPGLNNNANGTIEWHYNDFVWNGTAADFSYTFDKTTEIGLVTVSFKSGGDGSQVQTATIAGPCQGHYTISGSVYLDEPGETMFGIDGVEVSLYELVGGGYEKNDGVKTTTTAHGGAYSFEVWGPPYHSGLYQVRIEDVPQNHTLLDGRLFTAMTPLLIPVDVKVNPENDFVFEVNVDGALGAFADEQVSSDGMPRAYWRVQVTGKGSPKYIPDRFGFVPDLLDDFCRGFDVEWAFNVAKTCPTREEAAAIVQSSSKNDVLEALRTNILVLGLNHADGRGLCKVPVAAGSDCGAGNWDEPATRLILEHAIGALRNANYEPAAKAPTGSTESKASQLTCEVNNDC